MEAKVRPSLFLDPYRIVFIILTELIFLSLRSVRNVQERKKGKNKIPRNLYLEREHLTLPVEKYISAMVG